MKNLLIASFFVIFFVSLTSCTSTPTAQKVTTTVTSTEVTYSNQGFLVETQMVVKGNTVWGISQQVYGKGIMWRYIVALNPFLNNPTRLYYNSEKGLWIVRIYPGEVLNIGGQQVNPTYTYKETTTATTTEPAVPASTPASNSMAWWGWLLIGLGTLALIGLIAYFVYLATRNRSGIQRIDTTFGLEEGTRTAFLLANERDHKIQADALGMVIKAADADKLVGSFSITKGDFNASGNFRNPIEKETEPKKEEK